MRRPGASFFKQLVSMMTLGLVKSDSRQAEIKRKEEQREAREHAVRDMVKRGRYRKFRGRYHRKQFGTRTATSNAVVRALKPPRHHVVLRSAEDRRKAVGKIRRGLALFIDKQRARLAPHGDVKGWFRAYMGRGHD